MAKELTADQWRILATIAMADLQALGMDIEAFVDTHSDADKETVLKEIDRYMWDRESYS